MTLLAPILGTGTTTPQPVNLAPAGSTSIPSILGNIVGSIPGVGGIVGTTPGTSGSSTSLLDYLGLTSSRFIAIILGLICITGAILLYIGEDVAGAIESGKGAIAKVAA